MRPIYTILILVALLFLGNITSAQNLALNKAVTVSSIEGAFTGDLAVDGDLNTRWGSAFNEPEYIQVDLGDVFALDELKLYWEGAYAVRYTVEVSENGANYVTVDDIVNGNGGTDVISLTGNNGRYVRIICTERVVIGGAQYGFSLYEMEVTGSASPSSALLQDIIIDGVSLPTFSGNTFYYVQDLWDSLAVIPMVDAVPANPSATYTVTDATSLPGETVIEVTSADMSSMETYTIYFQQSRYNIVWQDEFDYTGPVDSTKWHHQTFPPANGSWFNGEEQHYTDRDENSYVENGTLKITAIRENYVHPTEGTLKSFTSARLNSKFTFRYGKVVVRAKLPKPKFDGTWPAIWTLCKDFIEPGGYWNDQGFGQTAWPYCGYVDIMEQGSNKEVVTGAFHYADNAGAHVYVTDTISVLNVNTEWHEYSMEWDTNTITLSVDSVVFHSMNNAENPYFDTEQYLLLNIAMGGFLGGPVDPLFQSGDLEVDYVRIYEKEILAGDTTNNDTTIVDTTGDTTSTSISTITLPTVSLHPNPSNGTFTVHSTQSILQVEVYNLLGKQVATEVGEGRHVALSMVQPTGLYFVKVLHDEGDVTLPYLLE